MTETLTLVALLWLAAIAVHIFLPTILARRDRLLIFIVSLVPIIGWITAMILAFMTRRDEHQSMAQGQAWATAPSASASPSTGMPVWLMTLLVVFTLGG